jgi:hypothetical protein
MNKYSDFVDSLNFVANYYGDEVVYLACMAEKLPRKNGNDLNMEEITRLIKQYPRIWELVKDKAIPGALLNLLIILGVEI